MLFEGGDETAGACFVLSVVMERSWLLENENFNSGFESAKNTEQSVGSVFGAQKFFENKKVSETDLFILYLVMRGIF